jgi:hypothetical protein
MGDIEAGEADSLQQISTAEADRLADEIDVITYNVSPYPGGFEDDGIVVVATNPFYLANAWVVIRLLRLHGCTLPIELWHEGASWLESGTQELFETYSVRWVSASDFDSTPGGHPKGPLLQLFAVAYSSFQRVLCLDADSIPVGDPSNCFENSSFLHSGSIFWPGIQGTPEIDAIWRILRVPFRREPSFDLGQYIIDKEATWEALQLALHLEELRRDQGVTMQRGDAVRFAWFRFGMPYAMPNIAPVSLAIGGSGCSAEVLCQHDFEGRRLFQHRSGYKWKLYGENPLIPGFHLDWECRQFLKELAVVWQRRVPSFGVQHPEYHEYLSKELCSRTWLLEPGMGLPMVPMHPAHPYCAGWNAESMSSLENGDSRPELAVLAEEEIDETLLSRQRPWREVRFEENGSLGRTASEGLMFWKLAFLNSKPSLLLYAGQNSASAVAVLTRASDREWSGEWLCKYAAPARARLLAVELVYSCCTAEGEPLIKDRDRRYKGGTWRNDPPLSDAILHVWNSAPGLDDHIAAYYACVGASSGARRIVFHTRWAPWFTRVSHPKLHVTDEPLPEFTLASFTYMRSGRTESEFGIDVNADIWQQLRFAPSRAKWYAHVISDGIEPERPLAVDKEVHEGRLPVHPYIVLAPFAPLQEREWPRGNWARLAFLLRKAGWEVVAVGPEYGPGRLEGTFGMTGVYWSGDGSSDWICDLLCGASLVIAVQNEVCSLAGLLQVPVSCLHAQHPGEFHFACSDVTSITPKSDCTFCRRQADRGFDATCMVGCSALASITPERALAEATQRLTLLGKIVPSPLASP